MKFRRFTKTKFLTEIGRELLGKFFERFQNKLEKARVTLPGAELADAPYYSALARVLLAPEDLPVEMSEVLFAIDALSSEAGEDQLEAAMKKEKPPLTFATKSSRADMAMQVWLARPELLARVYNEARLIRVSAFEFHGTPAPADRRKTFTLPDKARHAALVKAVDEWCQAHTRGEGTVQVGHHEIDDEHWFLVRHGDTYARTATVEQDKPVIHYRPAKDDVVVYAPEFDEIRIHAGTKGEKELYRASFGQYLHGDPNLFSEPKAYVLDRLRTHPDEAMSLEGFPGIKQVLLVEVELRWPGSFKDAIVKKSKDIFGSAASRKPPRKAVPDTGRVTRAKFEFLFEGETKPQTVTVKPVNELKVARHCDARLVHR